MPRLEWPFARNGTIKLKRGTNVKPKNQSADSNTKEQDVVSREEVRVEKLAGPSDEEIRQRAYEIHCERGCAHGQELDDWLQAERELKAKYLVG
jgi:hypothetical protein